MILATGVSYGRLGITGLESLAGAGVFYGASTIEAQAVAGKPVFVVGGGNSAGQAALHLAKYAEQVTLLVRSPSLAASMSDYLTREIERTRLTCTSATAARSRAEAGTGVLSTC